MRGQRPPRTTALTRLVLDAFALSSGDDGLEEGEMKPSWESAERKSIRSEVTSRTVEGEMKFYDR